MLSGKMSAMTTRQRLLKPRYVDLGELELLTMEH
jgi:hypothetical protein